MENSAEAHYCQQLASNQPNVREKALRKIGLWFATKSVSKDGFDEEKLLKMWKGIFYYFWHCDKMLVQEEKADIISGFVHNFKSIKFAFMFVDTFFQTMSREWHGIDRYRIEKFMMLIRRVLHQTYQLLKNHKWDVKFILQFTKMMKKTVISPEATSAPFGLKIHISDIYMEELAKVGADELTPKIIRKFLLPYCEVVCKSNDPTFVSSVKQDVLLYLINQDADTDKFHEFPILQFKPVALQKLLMKYANLPDVRRKNIKVIHDVVKEIEDFKNGITLGDKIFADKTSKRKLRKRAIDRATESLLQEEQECWEMKQAYKKNKKSIKKDQEVIDM
ncbi:hypothetical protein JTE90_025820 [Oedothorax gibbosus]|uniref:Uncharacterized protein n=1 Tax=Oedothorax gibbosus TaxID=931172 RepID=A0AAV6UTX5_9ARAC|nr:hypothetical protein JTE90_025820 [Oedothorax gibbosus]